MGNWGLFQFIAWVISKVTGGYLLLLLVVWVWVISAVCIAILLYCLGCKFVYFLSFGYRIYLFDLKVKYFKLYKFYLLL